MSLVSLGDMAQQFTSLRNGNAIKIALAIQTEQLSTGIVKDVTAQLNRATTRLSAIDYALARLESYDQVATETQQILSYTQTALSKVDQARASTAERLLLINDSSTTAQIDEATVAARDTFTTIVQTLNTQIADRSLLAGTRVDAPPLASAPDMIADLVATVGLVQDAPTIDAIVETWFEDPAGGFATMGYLGDTGAQVEKRISDTSSVELAGRADDPALREVLKGAALATLASALPTIGDETKATLLRQAGETLFAGSTDLTTLQAKVGFTEEKVSLVIAENAAEVTAFGLARNELVQADPFDTASRIQALQLQLETHFAATARLSELSLLRFI